MTGGAVDACPNRTNLVWAELRRSGYDYLVLDADLLRTHGIFFLRMVILRLGLPVLVLGGGDATLADLGLAALENGARGVIPRPAVDPAALERCARRIAAWADACLRRDRRHPGGAPSPPGSHELPPPPALGGAVRGARSGVELIAIGASAGGPESLRRVLESLAPDLPPVLIVQHMPRLFTRAFAERLNGCSRLEVREAEAGMILRPGLVVVGRGDRHLRVERRGTGFRTALAEGELVSGHRPSVDALFHSVARTAGGAAVGCLLTGMGADGADGLLEMRQAGAWTIAQDRESSIVFGMPGEAISRGAACEVLPLDRVAQRLHELVARRRRPAAPAAG
jgi:two-component system chemotaxis response regulator CheB